MYIRQQRYRDPALFEDCTPVEMNCWGATAGENGSFLEAYKEGLKGSDWFLVGGSGVMD